MRSCSEDSLPKTGKKAIAVQQRDVDLALYHLELGIFDQGSEPIDENALEKAEEFLKLKTQMKFFNGYTQYNRQEIASLRTWVKNKGPDKLQEAFRQVIATKPTSAASYEGSPLQKLLETI